MITKSLKSLEVCAALLFALVLPAAGQKFVIKDTTSPNQFYLGSDEYVVSEDATNVAIKVYFIPGNRSFSGGASFTTSDGTAIAGEDYTASSGYLAFNGIPERTINIPINLDNIEEGEETFLLTLSSPGSTVTRSNAVIRIVNAKPRPALNIKPVGDGKLDISWADDGTNLVLETSSNPMGTNWVTVTTQRAVANGKCCVTHLPEGPFAFYRLRKAE